MTTRYASRLQSASPPTRWALLPLLAALLLAAPLASAQVSGVGYRIAPTGTYIDFEDDAVLSDGYLYGGAVGLSFGEYVELTGLYLFGTDFETDFTEFSDLDSLTAAGLPVRDVDVQRYGGELKINLGRGNIVPFVTGGAGIFRFDPQETETEAGGTVSGLDATRSIYLTGGAGLQLTLADRYALTVQGEVLSYRYNPGTTFLAPGEAPNLEFNQFQVNNLALRAALQIYLGGRAPGSLSDVDRALLTQFSDGLGGLSLQIEPFVSRLNFDDAFVYDDQTFAGAEVGVDFGPLIGLRGFYGRGVDTDGSLDFDPVQMYGGFAKFRLSQGVGITPFVTFGAGYLDFLSDYEVEDEPLADVEDRPFAIGGAGVELPLGDRLRVNGEVRFLAMSTEDRDDVNDPDDVYLNPMLTAGLSLGLGGSNRAPAIVTRTELERQLAEERAAAAAREAELRAAIDRARAEGDSLAVARLEAERQRASALAQDTERELEAQAAEARVQEAQAAADQAAQEAASATAQAERASAEPVVLRREVRTEQGDRIVTIPLPETGELYVRYGDPGGVQIDSFNDGSAPATAQGGTATGGTLQPTPQTSAMTDEAVREAVRSALAEANAAETEEDRLQQLETRIQELLAEQAAEGNNAGISAAQLALIEQRMQDRMADEIRSLRDEIRDLRRADNDRPIVVPSGGGRNVTTVTPDGEVVTRDAGTDVIVGGGFVSAFPVVGAAFGDGPEQFVVGVRADYRTSASGSLRYYPEFLLGFGGTRSFALNVNGAFPFARFDNGLVPYGGLGLGLRGYADDDDDDTSSLGFTINLLLGTELNVANGRAFVEFDAVNFASSGRLLAGYRFSF